MQICPVNYNEKVSSINNGINFRHGHNTKNNYNTKQKVLVAGMSALGVISALAIFAKTKGHSLKPSNMFSDIKKSYLAKTDYKWQEVVGMGIGSVTGGLAAGYIIDKNPQNRRAKNREALMQIGNVSIPIITVDLFVDKALKNSSKLTKALGGLCGLVIGVTLANLIMNKINNWIFNENNGRNVKITDYTVHLDDAVVAANYIAGENKIVHAIGRLVPIALMIPGNEVGNKTANH